MVKGSIVRYRTRDPKYPPEARYEIVEVEGDGYVIIRGVRNAGQDMGRDWRCSAHRLVLAED